jgi:F-type H+-transporting ATPase subunit b
VKRNAVKKNWKRSLLAAVMLVAGLGLVFHAAEKRAQAQTASSASAKVASAPDRNDLEVDENDAYRKSPSVVWLSKKLRMSVDQASPLFEVGNFLLLAVALGWGLAKALPKALRSRNAAIHKHLVDARTATEEARTRLGSVEARLAKLDDEIAAMRAHAEQDSGNEEQRLKAAVEEEKKKILASAEQEIAAATMHAQKQLQQHAAELAIEQAARKLVVSAETDRLLVQGFAQRLAGDESKKGQN